MPTVTKLSPTTRRNGRTTVFLDGLAAFDLSDAVVANLGLRTGKIVSEDDIDAATAAERAHLALQAGLKFLEPRMRSRAEIVARLRRGGFEESAIEHALDRLLAMGLIDDAEFAARWVTARAKPEGSRPMGRRRLKSELAVKGIPAELAQQALDGVSDEEEHALALAAARKKARAVPTDPQLVLAERRRLAAFLQRRGFGWDVVKKVMDEVLGAGEDE